VLRSLQNTALVYLDKRAATDLSFWRMVDRSLDDLRSAADAIVEDVAAQGVDTSKISIEPMDALPGAGSAPGITMPSIGLVVPGDHLEALRNHRVPVIARSRDDRTSLDLRAVEPSDHGIVVAALVEVLGHA